MRADSELGELVGNENDPVYTSLIFHGIGAGIDLLTIVQSFRFDWCAAGDLQACIDEEESDSYYGDEQKECREGPNGYYCIHKHYY